MRGEEEMEEKLREECGVFGAVLGTEESAGVTYNALLALQHRGQEGAGIAVLKGGDILYHKDVGLVSEVFSGRVLDRLPEARMAIGHVRYSTTGANCAANTQPIVTEYLRGRLATAHNGNIINASELKRELRAAGCGFAATSDSEVISSLIAYEALAGGPIEEAVVAAARRLRGAYSLVVLSSQKKLIALRDPWGFRPLCIGQNEHGVAVASESCALEGTGFRFVRDIAPGELVVVGEDGTVSSRAALESERRGLCIFEYVYFARADSALDGLPVYEARMEMGRELARECPAEADIVCGVPDSGLAAAAGYAQQSGLPYVTGFVKNHYIGRSFIFPSQAQRDVAVRLKLNPLSTVEGKRVALIDDSIVRGTTAARIIGSLRAAGAKEVHFRVSSPPFRHACYFGTDIDSEDHLVANRHSTREIAAQIGADSLGYLSIQGVKNACKGSALSLCTGCFSGEYPLEVGRPEGKNQFEHEK